MIPKDCGKKINNLKSTQHQHELQVQDDIFTFLFRIFTVFASFFPFKKINLMITWSDPLQGRLYKLQAEVNACDCVHGHNNIIPPCIL